MKPILMLATPFLLVDDVVESSLYWRDTLGFHLGRSIGEPMEFAIMQRNAVRIMLRLAPRWSHSIARSNSSRAGDAIDLYISVSDVASLAADLVRNEADIL